jgi:glucosamine 6-phosphate synthetase-like amidotransferase/phosphosugar isomerase protein
VKNLRRVVLLACGTSYHAGLVGKFLIEGAARIPCEVDLASEFRYRDPVVGPGDLIIAISQSGETADTLAAVKEARAAAAASSPSATSSIPRFRARRTARCTRTPGRRSALRRPSASRRSWRRWRWWRSTWAAAPGR